MNPHDIHHAVAKDPALSTKIIDAVILVVIKAHLAFGFTVDVKGRDYNGLKDYLADLFHHVMNEEV